MRIPSYHVDAFTDTLFSGNPAAVCLLPKWLEADKLQKIAVENGLPVTAFLVQSENLAIRWFTPEYELDLCGHGTMAAAYVYFKCLDFKSIAINFHSKNEILNVVKNDDWITLNFPIKVIEKCEIPTLLLQELGVEPVEIYQHKDERLLIVLENESQVAAFMPNILALSKLQYRGVIITAPSDKYDFVSRTFYPKKISNYEDAVTGVSHCLLAPYWSERLNKKELYAQQLSGRQGFLKCAVSDNRVYLSSKAVLYFEGNIILK